MFTQLDQSSASMRYCIYIVVCQAYLQLSQKQFLHDTAALILHKPHQESKHKISIFHLVALKKHSLHKKHQYFLQSIDCIIISFSITLISK